MTNAFAKVPLIVLLGAAASARGQSQPPDYGKMAPIERYLVADKAAEILLARSAAPPSISDNATVLVLTPHGYEKAAEGTNGFVCFVDRAWSSPFDDPEFWNARKRGPTCMNPAAARSVLPLQLRQAELALQGRSRDEILARMKEAVGKKQFGPPEIGSMSYMMSKLQYLGDRNSHWHPHLMFYVPGDTNGPAWGANLPASPVFGGGQDLPGGGRMPWTIFFVPIARWSDGTLEEGHAGAQ
jgi:hypothetical protein